ncbi:MAG: hypothetical protein H6550_16190 [Chitinophagales bacterium]|nr:hypothetical protein [Chitinophagales bacterium]
MRTTLFDSFEDAVQECKRVSYENPHVLGVYLHRTGKFSVRVYTTTRKWFCSFKSGKYWQSIID